MTTILRPARTTTPWVLAVLIALLSGVVGTTAVAHAQEPTESGNPLGGGFGIRPAQASEGDVASFSYFTHRLEPGDSLVDTALVINEGESQVRLRVFVANAITAVNGGTSFGTADGSAGGVADWVTLDVDEVLLEPGATQIVRFAIAVPDEARSGDHVAGILVERVAADDSPDTTADTGQPQFAVNVIQRVGVAVVIAVGDEIDSELTLTDIRLGRQSAEGAIFEVAVDNGGNVMVDGTGTLTISDRQNNELVSIPFEVDTVLAKDPTFYYIGYPIVLADGDYLLASVVEYRALRENDTIHTTTLSGIELTIVNGQPKDPDRPESDSSGLQTVQGSTADRRSITSLALYAALAVIVFAGVALTLRRPTQQGPALGEPAVSTTHQLATVAWNNASPSAKS